MVKVIWTEPALTDLHEIIQYIGRDSKVYAARFGTKVVNVPRRLEESPQSGRVVPEFSDETIRELIYGSYRIIYKYKAEEPACYLVAVIHGSRDILRHLRPGEWNIE